jgi:hypothetical protein
LVRFVVGPILLEDKIAFKSSNFSLSTSIGLTARFGVN